MSTSFDAKRRLERASRLGLHYPFHVGQGDMLRIVWDDGRIVTEAATANQTLQSDWDVAQAFPKIRASLIETLHREHDMIDQEIAALGGPPSPIGGDLFHKMRVALAVADEVFTKHRIDGLDQNPKGVRDLVGAASASAEHWAAEARRRLG